MGTNDPRQPPKRFSAPAWLGTIFSAAWPPIVASAGLIAFFDAPGGLALAAAIAFGLAVVAWRHSPGWPAWVGRGVLSALCVLLVILVVTYDEDDEQSGPPVPVPPVAVARASLQAGTAPLRVVFDASQSQDPDSDVPLVFAWDLNGDGDFEDATTARAAYVYTHAGDYTARLRVSDGEQESFSEPLQIEVAPHEAPRRRTAVRNLTFADVPASGKVLGLTVSVGESDLRGEALEETLVRLIARTDRTTCEWRNVTTGDRFTLNERGRTFRIDALQVGYTSAVPADAQIAVTRRERSPVNVRTRCRAE